MSCRSSRLLSGSIERREAATAAATALLLVLLLSLEKGGRTEKREGGRESSTLEGKGERWKAIGVFGLRPIYGPPSTRAGDFFFKKYFCFAIYGEQQPESFLLSVKISSFMFSFLEWKMPSDECSNCTLVSHMLMTKNISIFTLLP